MGMPVQGREKFLAEVQVRNRIQIPVLVRWRNRLEPGEVLTVTVRAGDWREFYARYCRDFRITIPKLVAEHLELRPGEVVEITLHPESIVI